MKRKDADVAVQALRVVVADDVAEIRTLVASWLSEAGHQVTQLSSGKDVIDFVRAHVVDLVVTDLLMPGVDGLDTILAVNRIRPTTRVVAISGGGVEMPTEAGLRIAKGVGADAVLSKPFNRAQLMAAVEKAAR
jgi:CheY-like chemotaxis protein